MTSVGHQAKSPHILFFEERSLARRMRAWVVIGLVTLIYRYRFWRLRHALKHVVALPPDDRARYQLGRRFALGATAGFLASRYSLAPQRGFKAHMLHADVFGHWSSFLITADAAMDSKGLSRAASVALLRSCFHALFEPAHKACTDLNTLSINNRYTNVFGVPLPVPRPTHSYPRAPEFQFENYAIEMASIVGKRLAAIAFLHRGAGLETEFLIGLEEFYTRTLNLIDGQLSSLEQTVMDGEHDWGWYRGVLNSKSMDVLLTLLCLFVSSVPGRNPSEKMKTCFYLINRTFFHRQVLDDLLDVEEDLSSGAANSLVYMVVSQGRVAARCLGGDFVSDKAAILQEINRTCLLAREFSVKLRFSITDSLQSDRNGGPHTVGDIQALVREALVNREADRKMPLPELVKLCLARQRALLDAWAKRDWSKVIAIVKESGIAARILSAITLRQDQVEVESALRALNDENVREVMNLFYIRTLRTYEKCLIASQAYV